MYNVNTNFHLNITTGRLNVHNKKEKFIIETDSFETLTENTETVII